MASGNMMTMMIKLTLTTYISLSLILVDHTVLSCSSKSAPSRPTPTIPTTILTTTTTTTEIPKSESPGVWKTEADRSSHSQHLPLGNGHNEDLLVKPLPTQEDTGISERQGGSLSDDDETLALLTSDNYNNKNNKPLGLVQFSDKSIQCNDKTTAGYYLRKSPLRNNNIWIVFLEGGWYCFDERSCQNRWLRLKNLMTSSSWPHYKHVGGILSPDPSENPYWWSANHVFVPYCSSDSWSGTVKAGVNGSTFSFMGALIVDEVIKNLVKREGLKADSSVILAGSSAGGTGVLINLDRVDSLLNEEFGNSETGSPRVRGIADSGWFIDKLPSFSEKIDCHDVILCPPEISLKKGMTLWNARIPENCQSSYPDQPWSCFFGYRIYPTLKASLFVFQWLFDEAQILVSNVPIPALKKEEWDYIYRVGDELKKTLINVTNVFIPACMAHTVLTHRDWKRVEVNSVYLPRALKCWESGGIIEESNFIPSSRSSHRYWEEDEESSLSTVNRKSSNRIGNNGIAASSTLSTTVLEQSDFPVLVSSNDSSRRNRRRHGHNRHRHPNRPPNSKRERRQRRKRLEQDKKSKKDKPRNNALDYNKPSTLDVPVPRQRKRHNHENEHVHRRNNKHLRPNPNSSIFRRNSNSNSNVDNVFTSNSNSNHVRHRNNHNNNNSRKKPRNRRWFSVCDAGLLDGVSSGGDIRLIEKCTFPQCNPTCPKRSTYVDNFDIKDLLKSFGVNMGTMAKAMGIDLATLNSMDDQVLLQMLTQQA